MPKIKIGLSNAKVKTYQKENGAMKISIKLAKEEGEAFRKIGRAHV